jgi:hypothetical protein
MSVMVPDMHIVSEPRMGWIKEDKKKCTVLFHEKHRMDERNIWTSTLFPVFTPFFRQDTDYTIHSESFVLS